MWLNSETMVKGYGVMGILKKCLFTNKENRIT